MSDYTRPKEGFRFRFGGMKTNSSPDSMAPNKYPLAINVRSYSDSSIRTRPGLTQLFSVGATYTSDLRTYTELGGDNVARALGRTINDKIFLDNSVQVGSLVSGGSLGASMIPFRPNQSPNPYIYIANGTDYQKFSAPDALGVVTQQKVGIAEPQTPPEISLYQGAMTSLITFNGWTAHSGTAGALTPSGSGRLSDTAGVVFHDPNIPVIPPNVGSVLWSVQVSPSIQYQTGMILTIAGVGFKVVDAFPQIISPSTVASIFYFSGTTGRCIVSPASMGSGAGDQDDSIYSADFVSSLRRGAIIQIGAELCYVLSVAKGPDGTIAIETSTTGTHLAGESITSVPAIQVTQTNSIAGPTAGQAILSGAVTCQVTAGIGTVSTGTLVGFQLLNGLVGAPLQSDDYISIGLKIDNLANLNEVKLLFDVGDGTFTKDFYYYSIRPSDIADAVANATTQLGAVQDIVQRAIIDEEVAAASNNQLLSSSSAQTPAGSNVWAQITFTFGEMTRVGNDQTKSLQSTNSIQLLWNASGTINVAMAQPVSSGGFFPDVGDVGAPFLYRVRPRSRVTGVKGNPSPATRYGVSARRQQIAVVLPSAAYDPQIDTWDVFRYGGSVTSWRFVGSTPSSNSLFLDNFDDNAVGAGDVLDFDNYEPWPSVDFPLNVVATQVTGTIALVTIPPLTNALRFLPGNLVQLGGLNVYTLRKRPTLVSGTTYLFEFLENAGSGVNLPLSIYEPSIANQFLPYMWGPDVNGTVFAVGDPLRPGTLYFAKNGAPDSAPDAYNIEITPPTEPLLGGEVVDGLGFVGSTERWWALYPQPDNPAQRYNFVQQPITRGIAAPFGHCNDGKEVFFWAKDGIYGTSRGSLTDADLFNIFPHEGVLGQDYVYNGFTIKAPAYQFANAFRLTHSDGYLYAIYQDSSAIFHCLVLNLKDMSWAYDVYASPPACAYHVEQQAQFGGALNPVLLFGQTNGKVCRQTDLTNDNGVAFSCVLASFEFDGGDVRAGEQWGDLYLDAIPAAQGSPLTVTPMTLSAPSSPVIGIPAATVRTQQPVSLQGGLLANFLGILLQWTDDFAHQSVPTTVYVWQPSFIPKPENIVDRETDWDDAGIEGAKWIQGFLLHADTFNQVKGMIVRDADTLAIHPFTPAVQHNGESEIAYSFNQPFIAHMVRLEPAGDDLPIRLWQIRWVAEETPESAETWTTQPTSHGLQGFMHVRQVSIAYSSTAPVTLTIGVYDGTAPAPITLPSTGGVVKKLVFVPTFNKGQLYTYSMTSAAPFAVHQDKCEVLVGAWGRQDGYTNKPLVGERSGDEAKI